MKNDAHRARDMNSPHFSMSRIHARTNSQSKRATNSGPVDNSAAFKRNVATKAADCKVVGHGEGSRSVSATCHRSRTRQKKQVCTARLGHELGSGVDPGVELFLSQTIVFENDELIGWRIRWRSEVQPQPVGAQRQIVRRAGTV